MRKLIFKLGLLCIPVVLLYFAGYWIEYHSQWRVVQNPRTTMLWGGKYDGSRLLILGSSTLNSSRTDTSDQSVWSRLAARMGEPVFAGSLDGAQTADVHNQAKVVAASWPAGSVAFIDVAPTKFVTKVKTSSTESGNYTSRFANLVQIDNLQQKPSVYLGNLLQPLASHFFIYRNIDEVGVYLKSLVHGAVSQDLHNYRVWTRDPVAGLLFEKFSASLHGSYVEDYDNYFLKTQQILSARGIRPVFVLTGLNKPLIRQYAPDGGAQMIGMFERNRSKLKQYMETHQLQYLDLTDAVPSECFADMVHTTICGDDALAAGMQQWLSAHR